MDIGWNKLGRPMKILAGIIFSIAAIILMFSLWKIVPPILPQIATDLTSTLITLPGWLETPVIIILGQDALNSAESLILALVVFLILFFAFADIINMFSTFNEVTAWVIAFGLAIIAGVTKMINLIIVWLGLTAGIGAFGIGFIIISAIFTAVMVNLFIGRNVREAMSKAKSEKTMGDAAKVMKQGFGLFKSASSQVDNVHK